MWIELGPALLIAKLTKKFSSRAVTVTATESGNNVMT
jgi:hypothetical protein